MTPDRPDILKRLIDDAEEAFEIFFNAIHLDGKRGMYVSVFLPDQNDPKSISGTTTTIQIRDVIAEKKCKYSGLTIAKSKAVICHNVESSYAVDDTDVPGGGVFFKDLNISEAGSGLTSEQDMAFILHWNVHAGVLEFDEAVRVAQTDKVPKEVVMLFLKAFSYKE